MPQLFTAALSSHRILGLPRSYNALIGPNRLPVTRHYVVPGLRQRRCCQHNRRRLRGKAVSCCGADPFTFTEHTWACKCNAGVNLETGTKVACPDSEIA